MRVSPNLIVVPDGVHDDQLALSVQVAPCHVAGDSETIELEDWPAVIADLGRSLLVTVSELPLPTIEPPKRPAVSALSGFFFNEGPARLEAARQLWQRQFPGHGFLDLQGAVTWPAPASSTTSKGEPFRFLNRRTSDLTQIMEMMLQMAPDQSYPLRLALATTSVDAQRRKTVLSTPPTVADVLRQRIEEIAAVDGMTASIAAKNVVVRDCAAILCGIRDDFMTAMGQAAGCNQGAADAGEPKIDEDRERANRKLIAIQTIPSLAHYLGLALRVFIPVEYLGPLEQGAIRVEFGSAAHQRPSWTAFEYDRATGYFGPLPDDASGKKRLPLSRGLVRLAEKLDATHDRFMVSNLDPVNTLVRTIQQVRKRAAAAENDEGFDKLRRGFALFDRIKHVATLEAYLADAVAADDAYDPRAMFHAQDLIVGLRPDVAFAASGHDGLLQPPERWCPLTRRRVGCTDVIEGLFDEMLYADPAIGHFRHCEDGYAVNPECLTPVSEAHVHPVDEEMLSWCGESLAVSATNPQGIRPEEEFLDLSVTYDLGDNKEDQNDDAPAAPVIATDERLPPLREGRHYVFGCRVAYLNGAGRTFASAKQDYARDRRVLIGNGSSAIEFTPEAIPAPGLHFNFSDPQVVQASPRKCAGESVETLVVRSSEDEWDNQSRTRLLFPPRVTFEKAELEGQFDEGEQADRDVPIGPFSDEAALPVRLFMDSGDFPEAWAGQLCYWRKDLDLSEPANPVWKRKLLDIDTQKPVDMTSKRSRGTVALLGERSGSGVGQHFTTRHGRTAMATLNVQGMPNVPGVPLQFWGDGPEETHDARPVVLMLERGGQLQMEVQSRRYQLRNGGHVLLPHLVITLPAATTAELIVTPDFDGLDPGAQPAATRVTLVHAQRLPAKVCPVPGTVKTVTIDTTTDAAKNDSAWAAYVPTGPVNGWESQESGSQTYFVGELGIDRQTTGRVRMNVAWDEYDESRVVLKELGVTGNFPEWIERPKCQVAQIFDIEVEQGPDRKPFSLLRGIDNSTLRNLSHSFADGRARSLRPSLVTTSRYEKFFASEPKVALVTRECADLESVWTNCTFRPPPPDTDRIVPSFCWKTLAPASDRRNRITTRSGSQLRIYLSPGWYASGEGEQLGIVLLREGADEKTILETHRPFISRCGLDPLRPGGATDGLFLMRDNFSSGLSDLVEDVQLFVNSDAEDSMAKRAMQVDVLPLTVCREESTGALYCDVQVLRLDAYTPFVHLGLVRYQAHAVSHLRISTPIVRIAQILPFRRVETRRINHKKVMLSINGSGYDESPTCYSSLDLTLLNRRVGDNLWSVFKPLQAPDEGEIPKWPLKDARYLFSGGEFRFNANFKLANLSTREEFALLVEEYEHLPVDTGDVSEGYETMGTRLVFAWIQPLGLRE